MYVLQLACPEYPSPQKSSDNVQFMTKPAPNRPQLNSIVSHSKQNQYLGTREASMSYESTAISSRRYLLCPVCPCTTSEDRILHHGHPVPLRDAGPS